MAPKNKSAKNPKNSKKSEKNENGDGITKPAKKRTSKNPPYALYISKALKTVAPKMSIAQDSVIVMNGILENVLNRVIDKSFKTADIDKKMTLKSRHAQAAANIIFSGDLQAKATGAGEAAVAAYIKSIEEDGAVEA